ncbi:T9SS type A sorting domain-containing protein [Winogradskyella psychrotolerans]|uniref:T9SS type A sorting domain-containing protein n=1 Tax=Winogradskyella psychrotolerans TaxID=1344585 RepID=UPI001C06CCB4|nr:T9SS type A sorting domain-containing protein [Winogradskyella psychrotolerans]MBU2929524.1 T9SS type A sorting domain-containing protein [Winogradskyella psychrotolerans]
MKQLLLNLFTIIGVFGLVGAQGFTTPDIGGTYTLDDLVVASPTTISVNGTTYTLQEDLTISTSDTFNISDDVTLEIGEDIRITIYGTFNVDADNAVFTAIDPAAPYDGFRFEEFSDITIQNATIQYGGGLRVLTETCTIDNCLITNNVAGVSTGGAIGLSRGMPQITNNTITFNETTAIGSGATNTVSPYIFNNYIEGNNQENSNRPQINLGPTLVDNPTQIIQNTIKGDRTLTSVGGISVSDLLSTGGVNAVIDDNIISDNRYGIAIQSNNVSAYIRNNVIEDNDSQGNAGLGGSGINLVASVEGNVVVASGNEIRRNLWGITLQGESMINLGDNADNIGQNVFSENGNGGVVYALYNNTDNPVSAMHNCWDETDTPNTVADAEAVIVHENDVASLGLVTFDPVDCGFLSVDELALHSITIYPNPTDGEFNLDNNSLFKELNVYSIEGKLIMQKTLQIGANTLRLDLSTGMYLLELNGETSRTIKKLVVK